MQTNDRILVTGHKGLVGSALVRVLKKQGFHNIITLDRKEVDLLDPVAVKWAFSVYQPQFVFMAAARVGGIRANKVNQLGMFMENSLMQQNVLMNALEYHAEKVLFLGSSCIYPEHAGDHEQITEDKLLTGPLQPANEGYALAKIGGIKLGQYLRRERGLNVISAMPCNLFGPGDNFNEETAHVIPGMMSRMYHAKRASAPEFEVWGRPDAAREFLFSEDLADALIFLMEHYNEDGLINVGSDDAFFMDLLAQRIARTVGYLGTLKFTGGDVGTRSKKMSVAKLKALGWYPKTPFMAALDLTYLDFLRQYQDPSTPEHRITRPSFYKALAE